MCEALQMTNACGCQSWRSWLALMLDEAGRSDALALVRTELEQAQRVGHARRVGVALRSLGTLQAGEHRGLRMLAQAVGVLAASPARLEHARALVDLGAALRRRGERAAARAPLREGLDLANRCGAVRLGERARVELAAAGARPRRQRTTGRDALTPSERCASRRWRPGGSRARRSRRALFVTTRTIDTHLQPRLRQAGDRLAPADRSCAGGRGCAALGSHDRD